MENGEVMSRRTEIEELTAKFSKAVTNKDFAALGFFYEEGARLLMPGAPMVEGRAAIQSAQQRMIEGGVQSLRHDVIDIIEAGDLTIEIGRYTLTIQPPSAEVRDRPRQVRCCMAPTERRQPQIAVDTFNSDARPCLP